MGPSSISMGHLFHGYVGHNQVGYCQNMLMTDVSMTAALFSRHIPRYPLVSAPKVGYVTM